MTSSANSDTELLTEHFGYPPVSLLDDIINSVNILAERALNSVEQALLRQPPASLGFKAAAFQTTEGGEKRSAEAQQAAAEAAHQHEVENGTHQLETLLCASIDRNFDKFELYTMRNILCVRPEDRDWIRLAHYEGLDIGAFDGSADPAAAASAAIADDDAAIAHLHRRLQASVKLGQMLDAEAARNEALLTELRTVASASGTSPASPPPPSSLAFLLDRGPLTDSDTAAPLTTTTAFALSQLPALRQLSGELRQKAPKLAAALAAQEEGGGEGVGDDEDNGTAQGGGSKSWRRERLEYIEGTTRKHLERARGLNADEEKAAAVDTDGGKSSNGNANGNANGNPPAIEPAALTNILKILRENHGPAADEAAEQDGDAMDES